MSGHAFAQETGAHVADLRRARRARGRRRLALALLVAALEAILVALLGTLAGAAVAAAAIPAIEFHLLCGYSLRRAAARNVSRLAATAQTLAAAATLGAAAGPLEGFAVAATFAAAAVVLLLGVDLRRVAAPGRNRAEPRRASIAPAVASAAATPSSRA